MKIKMTLILQYDCNIRAIFVIYVFKLIYLSFIRCGICPMRLLKSSNNVPFSVSDTFISSICSRVLSKLLVLSSTYIEMLSTLCLLSSTASAICRLTSSILFTSLLTELNIACVSSTFSMLTFNSS